MSSNNVSAPLPREGQGGGSATLFDKIWNAHIVQKVEDGPTQLYIDRLYCHEVTSPHFARQEDWGVPSPAGDGNARP